MGRPVKDYWNWNRLEMPHDGDSSKHCEIVRFLESTVGRYNYQILAESDWPPGPRRYKVHTKYFYCIKDEKIFTLLALKYG